jgi:hypothetical protein
MKKNYTPREMVMVSKQSTPRSKSRSSTNETKKTREKKLTVTKIDISQKTNKAAKKKTPFRFYDNRQNYLSFINTTNEKYAIAKRAGREFQYIQPHPPCLRMYDAGMGDATVLSDCLRDLHQRFPNVPIMVVAKEISMEDVRIGLDKMVDRFCEHPSTVLILTNLNYADNRLMPSNVASANAMNWQEIQLEGTSSFGYKKQIESLHDLFAKGWETMTSPATGNPLFKRPSVMVIYRKDHSILLDSVIPKPGLQNWYYDFILASQPWRARTSAEFKAEKIIAPLARSLAPGGRMLVVQSCGGDPAEEVIHHFWPNEVPFPVGRGDILREFKRYMGKEARHYNTKDLPDKSAIFSYRMHSLPSEIGGASIGTSTLFAAWNASTYVNQIEDERIHKVISKGKYLEATAQVLNRYGGLYFNDETFVISRNKNS